MTYHLSKRIECGFEEAVKKTTESLKHEGFGIITTIDMKETFKQKLDAPFRKYTILGACNPRFAFEALQEEDKFGVFLPCNVVVQEHESGGVEVSMVDPQEMVPSTDNLVLRGFAAEIKASLQSALNRL